MLISLWLGGGRDFGCAGEDDVAIKCLKADNVGLVSLFIYVLSGCLIACIRKLEL
jgi:hypothetical protein